MTKEKDDRRLRIKLGDQEIRGDGYEQVELQGQEG